MHRNNEAIDSDELYRYGVPGMKWGKRKVKKWATSEHQPSSVKSSTLAGLYAATGNRKIGKALDKSNNKDAKNWERAKKEYKRLTNNKPTKSVKKYNTSYDVASRLSDKADKKWSEVNKMYKDLGKTKVTRLLNAKRGKSEAAKRYSKEYDKASKMSDKADAKWRETKQLRKKTGRNGISRTINNIRYSR